MKRTVLTAIVLVTALVFLGAPSALAYDETQPPTGKSCPECHGMEEGQVSTTTVDPTRKGPHGGYSTGTQKCATCHTIHNANLGSVALLPAATIKDTCNSCHDGTGGQGVYGVIEARGLTVQSAHDVEETNIIPGGALDGSSRTATFSADGGFLTCSDCHSPHDAATVEAFTGDRVRESTPTAFPGVSATLTNRLLKQRPTSSVTTVTVYGSDWCASCHMGRLSSHDASAVANHPSDSLATTDTPFTYENVARETGADTTSTEMGTLGANNYGYVMWESTGTPSVRSPLQAGHYPICQQCHEDARHVGDDPLSPLMISTQNGFDERFHITAADGAPDGSTASTDSPRFQVFPHESQNERLLIEDTTDDLCLNCHQP